MYYNEGDEAYNEGGLAIPVVSSVDESWNLHVRSVDDTQAISLISLLAQ